MYTANPIVTVSIILVNYNGDRVIIDCLESIQRQLHTVSYEVIVVDNASSDQSADWVAAKFPTVKLLRQTDNRGFGAGNNVGAAVAQGKYFFLLNTDTILTCDLLLHLVELMKKDPSIGIVGPQLLNSDGTLQLSTARSISLWGEYHDLQQKLAYQRDLSQQSRICRQFQVAQEVDIVVGAALFIRRSVYAELEGFDENFFMYLEESDLCHRAKQAGWKILYTPDVSLIHLGGYSINKTVDRLRLAYRRSQIYYYSKHRPWYEQLLLRFYLVLKFAYGAVCNRQTLHMSVLRSAMNLDQGKRYKTN